MADIDATEHGATRSLPRLNEAQRRQAQGNAAYERAFRELSDSVRASPRALPADADKVAEMAALLEEIKIASREKMMKKNQDDPRAAELMEPYEAPYGYDQPKQPSAPSGLSRVPVGQALIQAAVSAKPEPTATSIAREAAKPAAFKFKPVVEETPRNVFAHVVRDEAAVSIQLAWQQIVRGQASLTERSYRIELDGSAGSKTAAKDLLDKLGGARVIALGSDQPFMPLRDVYELARDDGKFHLMFDATDLELLVGAYDPQAKALGESLTLADMAKIAGIKADFVAKCYPKAPVAALMQRIYKTCCDSILARRAAVPRD